MAIDSNTRENMKYQKIIVSSNPYESLNLKEKAAERGRWPCKWISGAETEEPPFGVAYSRDIELDSAKKFRIHVTADERYELFINGDLMGRGPECGSPECWFYETYELELPAGKYNFTALVWSFGQLAPYAQMGIRHGFMLGADNNMHEQLDTGTASWEAQIIDGIKYSQPRFSVTGPEFEIDGSRFLWGIEQGQKRKPSTPLCFEAGFDYLRVNQFEKKYFLRPAILPEQLKNKISGGKIRYVSEILDGQIKLADSLKPEERLWQNLLNKQAVTVEPGVARRVIIDLDDYYCAYPEIKVSGGQGASVHIAWAEALFIENNHYGPKTSRDQVDQLYFIGLGDTFLPTGETPRKFRVPWWRCGRYLQLIVKAGAETLRIEALDLLETRYPLESESRIDMGDDKLNFISKTALRTLQMCLHETYMDCPYYERLMYVGDTRLQVLVNYAVSDDARAARKAIEMIKASILPSGLTQSRYPCRYIQVIPPFSLWWVGMVYDYVLWRGAANFIHELMPAVRYVFDGFTSYLNCDGLLEGLPGWNFVDWSSEWKNNSGRGMPAEAEFGVSGALNWHYVYTLRLIADLHSMLGDPERAKLYRRQGRLLADKLREYFYDHERGLMADTLDKEHFSEHSQCLAILSGYLDDSLKSRLGRNLLSATDLARTTIYFSHYLFETFVELDAGVEIFKRLELWKNASTAGFKTLPERPEPSRSDCHAWSAHPLYHFHATVAGIKPASAGFEKVRIKPLLGDLKKLTVDMPHPAGKIKAEYTQDSNGVLTVNINLPGGVSGDLHSGGSVYPLKSGENNFNLKNS